MTFSNGEKLEQTLNVAKHHSYVLMFDREGKYQRKIEIEDRFRITQLGMFQSGMFLAFGFDEVSHAPRLALFKDDGSLVQYLQFPEGDAPESALSTRDGKGTGPAAYLEATQFVPEGQSIIVVQNRSKYPLLEVSEAGAIRAIQPRLDEAGLVDALIPSDNGLYVRASAGQTGGALYQINSRDGSVIRRFSIDNDSAVASLACVHDGKFLSFEHGGGSLIPLIGTVQLAP